MTDFSVAAQRLLSPLQFTHPGDVGSVPAEPAIYGWWMRAGCLEIPTAEYQQQDGFELVYVGISPRKPSATRPASKGDLRKRLRQHVNGNASQSTLRYSLGVLLMDSLELTMRRRKDSYLWDREEALTAWMHENARVAYVVDQQPWLVENELLAHGVLALNIKGRRTDPFVQTLLDRRSAAQAAALAD